MPARVWTVMKTRLIFMTLAVFLVVVSVTATVTKTTDARNDGFLGPIRSVSTKQEPSQIVWRQPDGPTVALPVGCIDCEYDEEGNRIKSGESLDGVWHGEIVQILHNGDVTEKMAKNANGEVYRREIVGPDGILEQEGYENGKRISQSNWFYDGNGHVSAFRGYDRDGVLISSSTSVSDASGNYKEEWDYGPNGSFSLHFVETNEPKSDTYTFSSFNENGSIKVAFTTVGTKVISYRQETAEENVFGHSFSMDPSGKTQEAYKCHRDGRCDHFISYFMDESRHLVHRNEWHDADGALKYSADFEYELDAYGNWTKRTVWVWSEDLGERKLYATDYRAYSYWHK
jgi:hypothetical protein